MKWVQTKTRFRLRSSLSRRQQESITCSKQSRLTRKKLLNDQILWSRRLFHWVCSQKIEDESKITTEQTWLRVNLRIMWMKVMLLKPWLCKIHTSLKRSETRTKIWEITTLDHSCTNPTLPPKLCRFSKRTLLDWIRITNMWLLSTKISWDKRIWRTSRISVRVRREVYQSLITMMPISYLMEIITKKMKRTQNWLNKCKTLTLSSSRITLMYYMPSKSKNLRCNWSIFWPKMMMTTTTRMKCQPIYEGSLEFQNKSRRMKLIS